MFREKSEEVTIEQGNLRNNGRRNQGLYVCLVLSVMILIVLAPIISSWITITERTYSAFFVFKSENLLWHSGQLIVTYDDGYEETLIPYGFEGPMSNTTYAKASRNFTQPESWSIEYFCSGLNMTVGPISFVTDSPKVLYDNSRGQVIELWFGENN